MIAQTSTTTLREVPFAQFQQLKTSEKADDFAAVYSGAAAKSPCVKVVHADVLKRILATLQEADFLTLGKFRHTDLFETRRCPPRVSAKVRSQ